MKGKNRGDEDYLNDSIREQMYHRVGLLRTLFLLVPFSVAVYYQQFYLYKEIFSLEYWDYYYMFIVVGVISSFYILYMQAVAINSKGKELVINKSQDWIKQQKQCNF